MKNFLSVGVFGLVALAAFAGCGGGSDGASCGNTAACGGDVVGTWKITSSCVKADMTDFTADCPTATVSSSGLQITGTITYNADKTYTSMATISGKVAVTLPASCLSMGGVTVTCAQLQQLLNTDPSTPTTCTGSSSCTCTVTQMNQTSTENGTYTTTAAGLLTQTAAGNTTPDESDYCVKGTSMTQSPHAGSTMMGAGVTGTIVLSKS
jgi:hypothetical protein